MRHGAERGTTDAARTLGSTPQHTAGRNLGTHLGHRPHAHKQALRCARACTGAAIHICMVVTHEAKAHVGGGCPVFPSSRCQRSACVGKSLLPAGAPAAQPASCFCAPQDHVQAAAPGLLQSAMRLTGAHQALRDAAGDLEEALGMLRDVARTGPPDLDRMIGQIESSVATARKNPSA